MNTITVNANDAGQRIDKFLTKAVPLLPSALLYKYIRKKRIKLNGNRCEISQRLKENDVISLYINDEFFAKNESVYDFLKAPTQLSILYEDENILLLDKKPGLLSHPDENNFYDSLILRVQHYLYEKKEYIPENEHSFVPSLVNRIDRNTGGIVLAAKNAEALRILNEKMKNREIKKFYLCIAHGIFEKKSDTLVDFLEKNESQNRVYVSKKPTAKSKTIKTKYKVLDEAKDLSLLEVELLTGRTHQIRAHMAFIGHPLLGDGKYGTNALNKPTGHKWQSLYSYKIAFEFSSPAGMLDYLNGKSFVADDLPLTEDFYRLKKQH